MIARVPITPVKTYASIENVEKAIAKKFPDNASWPDSIRYFIVQSEDGRFFPVFIGQKALHYGIHFHFNVVG